MTTMTYTLIHCAGAAIGAKFSRVYPTDQRYIVAYRRVMANWLYRGRWFWWCGYTWSNCLAVGASGLGKFYWKEECNSTLYFHFSRQNNKKIKRLPFRVGQYMYGCGFTHLVRVWGEANAIQNLSLDSCLMVALSLSCKPSHWSISPDSKCPGSWRPGRTVFSDSSVECTGPCHARTLPQKKSRI